MEVSGVSGARSANHASQIQALRRRLMAKQNELSQASKEQPEAGQKKPN